MKQVLPRTWNPTASSTSARVDAYTIDVVLHCTKYMDRWGAVLDVKIDATKRVLYTTLHEYETWQDAAAAAAELAIDDGTVVLPS